jgi:hypothetical protein
MMGHPLHFSAVVNTLLPITNLIKRMQSRIFGNILKPRLSVAQEPSMGELLRFLSMMAASKPTSSLSMDSYILACT